MINTLIIYNTGSGRRRRSRLLPIIKKKLQRPKYLLDFKSFEIFLESKDLANNFNYDLVIVAGGDGTIRNVASFLLKNNISVPIGLLPTGSANVLAQSLAIPRSLRGALRVIDNMKTTHVDVGLINNQHYFIEAFSMGYLAERIVAAQRKLKRAFGFAAYFISFILSRHIPQYLMHFTVDGQEHSRKGNSLFIANTSRFFGFEPKRRYDMQDGQFEIVLASNKTFLSFFQATYYYSFHDQPPKHLSILKGSHFTLELKNNTQVQVDGDYLKIDNGLVTIDVLSKKLCLIHNRKHAPS